MNNIHTHQGIANLVILAIREMGPEKSRNSGDWKVKTEHISLN